MIKAKRKIRVPYDRTSCTLAWGLCFYIYNNNIDLGIHIKILLFNYLYIVIFITIVSLISNTHSMEHYFLFWKELYFSYGLFKKIGQNIHNLCQTIHNLCQFYWYNSAPLFSHLWNLLIQVYDFKYLFFTLKFCFLHYSSEKMAWTVRLSVCLHATK